MTLRTSRLFAGILALTAGTLGSTSWAQSQPAPTPLPTPSAVGAPSVRIVNPKRETLARMLKPLSVDYSEARLEDVLAFIKDQTGADLEFFWMDNNETVGLDKDKLITIKSSGRTALDVLERVLETSQGDISGENAWQMAESGEMQIGPKERLNKFRRLEIYDIRDLIVDIPEYDRVPTLDLQSTLQSGQGGGGQSPFRENQNDQSQRDLRRGLKKERTDDIIKLITEVVEQGQWVDNGGSSATIRDFHGSIIVNAPDYIHRGIAGYPYWPDRLTSVSMVQGKRYVSFGVDTGISNVDGFAQSEATAVVNGKVIKSGPGGGR